MGSHTVNENKKNKEKIGLGAGKDSKTFLACMEIIQKSRDELEEEWNLEAKGKLHKSVMESLNDKMNLDDKDSYIVIRAYANKAKEERKTSKSMEDNEK